MQGRMQVYTQDAFIIDPAALLDHMVNMIDTDRLHRLNRLLLPLLLMWYSPLQVECLVCLAAPLLPNWLRQ